MMPYGDRFRRQRRWIHDAMSTKSAALIADSAEVLLANRHGFPGRTPAALRGLARHRFLDAARIARRDQPAAAARHFLRAARTLLP